MTKTLTKFGNSTVLTIPRPVLELLKITPDTHIAIELTPDSKGLTMVRSPGSKRTLTKFGDYSMSLVIPPAILRLVGIDLKTTLEVELSADHKALNITRAAVPEKKRKAG